MITVKNKMALVDRK